MAKIHRRGSHIGHPHEALLPCDVFVHPGVTDASYQNLREGMAILVEFVQVVGESQTRTTMQELCLTMTGELFCDSVAHSQLQCSEGGTVGHNRDRRALYGILPQQGRIRRDK